MRKATLARVVRLFICTPSLLASNAQSRKISGSVEDDKVRPLADATSAANFEKFYKEIKSW
jgi:hypothetical protein